MLAALLLRAGGHEANKSAPLPECFTLKPIEEVVQNSVSAIEAREWWIKDYHCYSMLTALTTLIWSYYYLLTTFHLGVN